MYVCKCIFELVAIICMIWGKRVFPCRLLRNLCHFSFFSLCYVCVCVCFFGLYFHFHFYLFSVFFWVAGIWIRLCFVPSTFYFPKNCCWRLLLKSREGMEKRKGWRKGDKETRRQGEKCARCASIMRTSGWKCLTRIKAKCSQLAQANCVCESVRVCVCVCVCVCWCVVFAVLWTVLSLLPFPQRQQLLSVCFAFGAKFENNLKWRHHVACGMWHDSQKKASTASTLS